MSKPERTSEHPMSTPGAGSSPVSPTTVNPPFTAGLEQDEGERANREGDPRLCVIRRYVGGCREELGAPSYDKCWEPAEYVLWGKLIPPEGLGPRCYEHARGYIDAHSLASGTTSALIHLGDLARDLEGAETA